MPPPNPQALECIILEQDGTLSAARIATIQLPAGITTPGPTVRGVADYFESVGRRGDDLFVCSREGRPDGIVIRIDATTGDAERSDVPCQFVTADAFSIVVASQVRGYLRAYSDWGTLRAQRPRTESNGFSGGPHSYTLAAGALLGADDDGLWRFDLESARRTSVPLARRGPSIRGLSAVDTRLVTTSDEGLDLYERASGAHLEHQRLAHGALIACEGAPRAKRMDSCRGKADGAHCSELASNYAYLCEAGARGPALACPADSHCQTDALGLALMQGDQLVCAAD